MQHLFVRLPLPSCLQAIGLSRKQLADRGIQQAVDSFRGTSTSPSPQPHPAPHGASAASPSRHLASHCKPVLSDRPTTALPSWQLNPHSAAVMSKGSKPAMPGQRQVLHAASVMSSRPQAAVPSTAGRSLHGALSQHTPRPPPQGSRQMSSGLQGALQRQQQGHNASQMPAWAQKAKQAGESTPHFPAWWLWLIAVSICCLSCICSTP